MAGEGLLAKVQGLSDLELAVMLSLTCREHCLISTAVGATDDLVAEFQLIATKTFGLQCVTIDCTPSTTLEEFASALLVPRNNSTTPRSASPFQTRTGGGPDSYFVGAPLSQSRSGGMSPLTTTSSAQIAQCVLAKNLDRAPQAVQIQALELLRTRRIFTRTSVQTAPKQFIFIPVLESATGGTARVTKHLNDFFFIAHWHDPNDGYVNLEDVGEGDRASIDSASSVLKREDAGTQPPQETLITEGDLSHLTNLARDVQVDVDVVRYQMNVVSFLRMHRAVSGGVTPNASQHLGRLMRCLAPLNGIDYVTPAVVGLAVKKIYLHRLNITIPEKERSMQWGSSLEAITAMLDGIGPEEVIEDILEMVTAPV